MTKQEEQMLQRLIHELRQRAKEAFDRDMQAIEHVERLALNESPIAATASAQLLLSENAPTLPDNGISEESEVTLIDSVANLFVRFPNQPWNVNTVERQLLADRFVFVAKTPKSSINTALTRLTERGEIRISKRGSGRKPHVYRMASPTSNPAEVNGHVAMES